MPACIKCAQILSPAARNCPKCGSPANAREMRKQFGDCNSCGTQLNRYLHKSSNTSEYLRDGTTHYSRYVTHTPCSNCGDPAPLASWDDSSFLTGIVGIVLIGVVCAVIFGLFVLFAGASRYFGHG